MSEEDSIVYDSGVAYTVMKKKDFRMIRDMCRDMEGWTEKFRNDTCVVWTKPPDPASGSKLNMIKLLVQYPDVDARTLYDCLHDPDYRKTWDHNMLKGYNICRLDVRNDIGYYGVKFPMPLGNRDFCNMRSWIELGPKQGFIIRNHSVPHPNCPEQKGFTRGRSIISGYYIMPKPEGGCNMYWMSQSDPGGFLPHWAVNMATSRAAPSIMAKLGETAREYLHWVAQNKPGMVKTWDSPVDPWSDEDVEDAQATPPAGKSKAGTTTKGATGQTPAQTPADRALNLPEPTPAIASAPLEDTATIKEMRLEIERLQRKLVFASQDVKGFSLAPMRFHPEEPECIAQARKSVQEALDFVDRSFLAEQKIPTMREYCTRVHNVLGTLT